MIASIYEFDFAIRVYNKANFSGSNFSFSSQIDHPKLLKQITQSNFSIFAHQFLSRLTFPPLFSNLLGFFLIQYDQSFASLSSSFMPIMYSTKCANGKSRLIGYSSYFQTCMGLSSSCPFAACTDLETSFTSITFDDNEAKSLVRSISFKNQDYVMQSLTSQKMKIQESFSLKVPSQVENESIHAKKHEIYTESSRLDDVIDEYPGSPKHEAAIKLQKVYKSFRTRRKLADCAVLIEQSWWKLLDFAELKRSSISFFDIDKHETAISRWSRARIRAAKVGKGLSQNCKAQKLALQHWLEAIDPRHRYGHNLHFYYLKWLHSQSKEPFFYWLDIGEGKEVNLIEKCPRSKLQQQCIKYLGPMERKAYEVMIEDGKLFYKQTGKFIDTKEQTKGAKWIFVLSTYKTLYVGIKKKGSFQHSSFLAGGATLAAGRIIAEKGVLKAIWPHSGHYHPTQENFRCFIAFLKENGVDTTYVEMDSDDNDDKESFVKQNSLVHIRAHSSEEDMSEKDHLDPEEPDLEDIHTPETPKKPRLFGNFTNLTTLEIPKNNDLFVKMNTQNQDYSDNEEHEPVPDESILKRIDSHKETSSFQLGRQLSCKWSTGAGPRIGCLRDYPTELQSHALEQANLSPRSSKSCSMRRNSRVYRAQSSPLNAR